MLEEMKKIRRVRKVLDKVTRLTCDGTITKSFGIEDREAFQYIGKVSDALFEEEKNKLHIEVARMTVDEILSNGARLQRLANR